MEEGKEASEKLGEVAMEESQGTSELEQATSISTTSDSLDSSAIFHLVSDILGFVLFMHQQIPSVLQDITQAFDELRTEYKELEAELGQCDAKARRKQATRKREVRMGIKRFEKLMKCISNLKSSLQLVIAEVPNVEKMCLVLGPSTLRPLYVYELCFLHGRIVSGDFSRTKVTEALCRKAIRTLISRGAGAGSNSYAGPTKLFLLVQAPASLNLPLHFLVKREIRENKKITPYRLRFRCRNQSLNMDAQRRDDSSPVALDSSAAKELIWFQCRNVIKGMPCGASPQEE